MTEACDVLVVGGGPGGSAAATLFARRGLRTVVADRASFPRDKPCSEYMSPEAVRLLDRLDVLPRLSGNASVALRGTSVTGPAGARLRGRFDRAPRRPWRPTGLALPRRVLDQAVVDVARDAGATIRERSTFLGLLREGRRAVGAVFREPSGREVALGARLVIGADGLRTRVGAALGPRAWGRPARMAFTAHVRDVAGLDDEAEMYVARGGYVGLNPIGAGVANVAIVVPLAHAAGARGDLRGWFFRELDRRPGIRGRVPPAGLVAGPFATGPFAVRSRRVIADGALLLGDAAEFFDPFTGEGIWRALRGAELADQVAGPVLERERWPTAQSLRPYLGERRRSFAGVWAVERLIAWAMLAPPLFDRAIGRLAARRGMADTLVGVTGAFVPARAVLNPVFLSRMLL